VTVRTFHYNSFKRIWIRNYN